MEKIPHLTEYKKWDFSLSKKWILKIITKDNSYNFDLNTKLEDLQKNPNINLYIWDKKN